MRIPPVLRHILEVTFRWAAAWSIFGLIAGMAMMFGKVELIAESGAKPKYVFTFWIPLLFGIATVFGVTLGFLFASFLALANHWLAATEMRPSSAVLHGMRLLCGMVAGGLIGWLVTRNRYAWIFAGLGVLSAVVSCVANQRKERLEDFA